MEFPGVKALNKVCFSALEGEVHALLGENGAGKSTLMKILSGVLKQTEGDIFVNGEPFVVENTKQAAQKGISIIFQELNLVPQISVAENIYLGKEPKKGPFVDWNRMRNDSAMILVYTVTKIFSMEKKEMAEMIKLEDLYSVDIDELISLFYYRDYSPAWSMKSLHSHPAMEIGFVIDGIGYLCTNSDVVKITKNEIFVMRSNFLHRLYVDSNSRCKMVNIQIDMSSADKNNIAYEFITYGENEGMMKCFDVNHIGENMTRLIEDLKNRHDMSEDLIRAELYSLFMRLRSMQMLKLQKDAKYNNKYVLSAIEMINNMIEDKICPQLLAEKLHISKDYLMHVFSQTMGTTIMQYVMEQRLKKAQKLLIKTNLSLSEIAMRTGFCSSQHFSSTFKKEMDISPSQYRKVSKYVNETWIEDI